MKSYTLPTNTCSLNGIINLNATRWRRQSEGQINVMTAIHKRIKKVNLCMQVCLEFYRFLLTNPHNRFPYFHYWLVCFLAVIWRTRLPFESTTTNYHFMHQLELNYSSIKYGVFVCDFPWVESECTDLHSCQHLETLTNATTATALELRGKIIKKNWMLGAEFWMLCRNLCLPGWT